MSARHSLSPSSSRRRSRNQSLYSNSPDRAGPFLSGFLSEHRNSELSHRDALAAAQAEHDRVREAAIRVYELHELQEEQRRVQHAQRTEHERLRIEAELVAEERRLRELRAQTVPKLPPEPELPKVQPRPAPAVAKKSVELNGSAAPSSQAASRSTEAARESPFAGGVPAQALAQSSPFTPASSLPSPLTTALKQQPNGQASSPFSRSPLAASSPFQPAAGGAFPARQPTPSLLAQPTSTTQAPSPSKPATVPVPDRYVEIHRALKALRRDVMAQSKAGPLKGRLGDMRREIRKSIGQLTDVRGGNAQPVNKILVVLKDALEGRLPSTPVDVSAFVLEPRSPVEGSALNDTHLPSLFIYLLNILSKSIINQFVNECSAKPETADPIGVVTAQIFSQRDFQWRGRSLIDVLLAKFRVACPVLFGHRASDRTAAGRAVLGWKAGLDERVHLSRMVGLGAGYAAIALRDFSKASKVNPYPPSHYWRALAFIVNTAPAQMSDTQVTVLKAMIDGHEQRFITFYGNAALAALRAAVVEFPLRAPTRTPPVGALVVLGDLMKRDRGLNLF